jgi:AcrR family transcriptional regulator
MLSTATKLSPSTRGGTLLAVEAATRPYHHGDLRRALLERAERRLADGGPGELSLRELAREIGVSHAAPRRHFPDKQALLDALAETGFARLEAELGAAARSADGKPFAARMTAVALTYVRFATRHPALLDLMFAAKHRPHATDALREAAACAFAAPLGLVSDAQERGEIVGGDVDRVALPTWAMIHGVASMATSGLLPDVPLESVVRDAVERLVLGLRPR